MADVTLGTSASPDVLVVGAGPAGCAAAKMLASMGHRILLVDRPSTGRHTLAESIPPSANRLLVELDMKNAVEAAGFHPWLGNTVWWGSDEPRVESFAAGDSGYQVERDRFDAVLRSVAARAGAQVVTGIVREVHESRAAVEIDGRTEHIEARIVLDCSGRAGVLARKGLRRTGDSHHTIALAGVWRAASAWPSSQHGHTLVASHADGWAWSVPIAAVIRYVTVMVDPERSNLARGVPALDVYRAELKKVKAFEPLLESAELTDGPWGADASLYSTERHGGPGFLLVGDAASFIDPLSSFGVKKAIASGWLAAITANTMLKTPEMSGEALAFYERHERQVAESFRHQAARFAESAVKTAGFPFWDARTGMSAEANSELADRENRLRAQTALDDLRRRPEVHLVRSARARTGLRSAVRGDLIVREDHLFVPEWPEGRRYLRNIDLLLMLELAPHHRDVGEMYDAVFRAQPGISLPDFLAVLSTVIAVGALEHSRP